MKHATRVTVEQIRARAGWTEDVRLWHPHNGLMRLLTVCMGWQGEHGLWFVGSYDTGEKQRARVYTVHQLCGSCAASHPCTFDTLKRAQARAKFLAEEGCKDL